MLLNTYETYSQTAVDHIVLNNYFSMKIDYIQDNKIINYTWFVNKDCFDLFTKIYENTNFSLVGTNKHFTLQMISWKQL